MSEIVNDTLESYREQAEIGIARMRPIVSNIVHDAPVVVALNGSYARREVTSGSDVDLILLMKEEANADEAKELLCSIQQQLSDNGFKLAASGGVFDEATRATDLYGVIGGQDDGNSNITRRMLLLLEGEWLHNKAEFDALRKAVIKRYVNDSIRSDQIALFLLNDIIRYWRTICVDYEHKIGHGKAAEIRLLKLRFSRMLLYMGGVVAVGKTYDKSPDKKRRVLHELLALPPAMRIEQVMGTRAEAALEIYIEFLKAIDSKPIRAELSELRDIGQYSERYLNLRNKAKSFRRELKGALENTFPAPHPLLSALML